LRVHELASGTGKLECFIIFGSYVTAKPDPNDVDIILVMRDDFQEQDYTDEVLPVLDHQRSQRELGASVFWTRPAAVLLESVDEFVAYWQVTRELGSRGIIEVVVEATE
jgi:predicted nucleotidyltransferase